MLQGQLQRLQFIASEEEILRFQLAEQAQIIIEYHSLAQYWKIEHQAEQAIYGKANHTL